MLTSFECRSSKGPIISPPRPAGPGFPMPLSSPAKSMFFRRLAMILALVALGMAFLTGQLWRLTVAQGAALYDAAEAKLVTKDWVPTKRGMILDRKGRILAQDRPAFDIAVDFRCIGGQQAGSAPE